MLGYFYSISGEVIHGKKIGRTIGYPTANITTMSKRIKVCKRCIYWRKFGMKIEYIRDVKHWH